MVNKPELLFSGAAFLVCANNDFSSFQTYFSDSSRLWSWFHETVSWVLEGLQDEKHHHHMLQCIGPLQTGVAYSNAFIKFWRNNFVLADYVLGWVLHVHAAFTRDLHALTFFWWKWVKLLFLRSGWWAGRCARRPGVKLTGLPWPPCRWCNIIQLHLQKMAVSSGIY